MLIAKRSTSGIFGPRSTKSPRKITLRPSGGVDRILWRSVAVGLRLYRIAKLLQQIDKLIEATMHIADDVERPVFMFQIVPKRLADDLGSINFLGRAQEMHMPETFSFKQANGIPQLTALLPNDVWPKVAIRAVTVPFLA